MFVPPKFRSSYRNTQLLTKLSLTLLCINMHGQESIPIEEPPLFEDASEDALISEREEVEIIGDSNLAEAVARRPDLQFNNIIIDGERSNISLNDIPADAVSELEVLRAVTPDLDADSRGGSLNLSSTPTFNLEKPVIKADFYYEYSADENTWKQGASATYGHAFGNIGFRVTASQKNEHDISEAIRIEWRKLEFDSSIYAPSYLFETFTESWRLKYNFNGSMDYRISENFHLFTRVNYVKNFEEAYEPSLLYKFESGDYENVTSTSGYSINAQVDRDLTAYESTYEQIDIAIGGVLDTEKFKLDFRIYDESSYYEEPDWTIIQFKNTEINLNYHLDSNYIPIAEQSTEPSVTKASNFVFDEYLSEHWQDSNDQFVTSVNARYHFEIVGVSAYIKTGIKYTNSKKDQRSDSKIYTSYKGNFAMDEMTLPSGAKSLLIDGLNYGSFPTLADSRSYLNDHFGNFGYDLKRSAQKGDPATYFVKEDISAAYMMLDLNHKRFRSILGFRVEKTNLEYRANEVVIDENSHYVGTLPQAGSNGYRQYFPSVHLRYFLGNRITCIGSWTATIKRPYYGDIVPYRYINYDNLDISEGNPQLSPTLYDNFDFSIDYKLSDSSLFSIELFSKEVDDIVYWEVTDITSGVFNGFTLGRHENGPSATERGFRLILTQNLEEWMDVMKGFSLILKMTFQDSETQYPGRNNETLPVTYRPETIIEATLTYENGPLFAQLHYSHLSRELQSVYSQKWLDIYQPSRNNLSLSTSINVSKKFRVYLDIYNMLGTQFENYYGDPSRPASKKWRSTRYELGLKYSM